MNKYIKSAFNYTGGKYKLLDQLLPLFPLKYNRFIDLFAGSAVVSINIARLKETTEKEKILINDMESNVINFYKYIVNEDYQNIIKKIEEMINTYNLSLTMTYGYEYYDSNSLNGVAKYNKENYLKLRNDFNNDNFSSNDKNIAFYLLTVYGFNNQIRFNKKGNFNLPVGKRDFNKTSMNKLKKFHKSLVENKNRILFSNDDFRNIKIKHSDFVYVDPPYSIGTASYNENGSWKYSDDEDLFEYLDHLNSIGAKFAMSNLIEHKGKTNSNLKFWASKYKINPINFNYNNSNYQSTARKNKTQEVLITNYEV
ncbi:MULTISPECIES: DNA adenine methylase [Aerococcus]|uniref:DNA adenine methylase n=1 Tax=Aerococcus TaxID=1375 RepID=UPI001E417153|nr:MULTISPECIES: Dam family site-specific DNA-(adenine-N6)-methyltransferase [Aerococcus]MCY3067572.1 Dam family site-specific DNA-(adenine-N6)-methyltransferase [Aerococcus mictus]MCY3080893.1 Dam family site-specific DNA-(adenine-N6)-methyltransferase [Aerococcus mictus]MDK8485526.1 Dam family site-specific DNA-(adenine-N6)-methyltransferase [Aerococcus urinae]